MKRLTNHLDKNGPQEDYQSAYKLMHGTETTLYYTFKQLEDNYYSELCIYIVYLVAGVEVRINLLLVLF